MKKRANTVLLLAFLVGASLLKIGCSSQMQFANLPPDELFTLGREMHERGKYIRAIEVFQAIVYNYPGETVVDSAQYYLALSYFGNEDYILAEREFNRLLVNYPSSPYANHAQFMRAVCFFEGTPKHFGLDQTDLTTAIRQFEDFIIDHPESELSPDAHTYLLAARTRLARKYYEGGRVYIFNKRPSPAKTYLQKVIDDFTDTEYAARASFQIAELEFNRKDYQDARRRFNDFLTLYPDHEWSRKARERAEEAVYEMALAAFDSGEFGRARRLFEEYKADYPEGKRSGKAEKYLKKIAEMPLDESTAAQADSGTDG